ncbi:sensor histidine kinase [Rhodospirillum rubrum]|uniref:histidine kinase n=2 Tax=Rhodospirillum rubrum TaxID=1085 RepID=Q2RPG2_RHORT|nr:HAMP domain-containing sensor histidine kinase [Rhodospirillum rubrum]ABC23983.1 histidine kinase [Rhodospirillum rubrum ATCC 11170]MBK5955667.1 sensor histidine kinase [Rhodospirillum rubrum]
MWLAGALAATYLVISYAVAETLERGFDETLAALVDTLTAAAEITDDGTLVLLRDPGDPRFTRAYSGWYWQMTWGDQVVRSRSLWDQTLVRGEHASDAIHIHRERDPRGRPLEVVERDIFPPRPAAGTPPPSLPAQPVHVMVAGDRTGIEGEIARLQGLLALCLAGLGGGLLAATFAQVSYGLRPLDRLRAALHRARDDPSLRLEETQPGELAPLAQALNALLDHNASLIDRARAHVGNLAHGLKTPLAVLRSAADDGPTVEADMVRAQTATMGRLVERHLARARASVGQTAIFSARAPILAAARRVGATMALIHCRPLDITIDGAEDAAFPGAGDDLLEILGNLMDNACKWAKARVAVHAGREAGRIILTVEDDGPGLAEDEARTAPRRGARLDDSLPGHGLGLDIVADLAALHGATLTLDRSRLGGLRATLRLPPAGWGDKPADPRDKGRSRPAE